jgi:hypothetical protein
MRTNEAMRRQFSLAVRQAVLLQAKYWCERCGAGEWLGHGGTHRGGRFQRPGCGRGGSGGGRGGFG